MKALGTVQVEFFTTRVSVRGRAGGNPPALLDENGSAIVIHHMPDDHVSQPVGGAGGRIGCGVVRRSWSRWRTKQGRR